MSIVTANNLEKIYRIGDVSVNAIRGVDFTIEPASFVSFVGPSGSGKSTLVKNILYVIKILLKFTCFFFKIAYTQFL